MTSSGFCLLNTVAVAAVSATTAVTVPVTSGCGRRMRGTSTEKNTWTEKAKNRSTSRLWTSTFITVRAASSLCLSLRCLW